MDLTEKYIIMCEQEKEIQKEAEQLDCSDFKVKNYFAYSADNNPFGYLLKQGEYYINTAYNRERYDGIWLPRQDDLQNLLTKEQLIKLGRLTFVYDDNTIHVRTMHWIQNGDIACIGKSQIGYFTGDTMEKLWLQIVMKEKYNKLWDEKKQEWMKNVAEKT